MFTIGMNSYANSFFRDNHVCRRHPDGNQKSSNWLGTMWGGADSIQDADAVLYRLSLSVFDRWPHRHHAGARRLSIGSLGGSYFRRRAFSLRDRWWNSLCAHLPHFYYWYPENYWKNVQRNSRQTPFLAIPYRFSPDVLI